MAETLKLLNYLVSKRKASSENDFFKKLGFTPCKTEEPLQGMELQEKEAQKD